MKLKIFAFLILIFFKFSSLEAQDFILSFEGAGASTTVETVKVENLMKGTTLTMNGNNYPVVKINNQVWMAENLRTGK